MKNYITPTKSSQPQNAQEKQIFSSPAHANVSGTSQFYDVTLACDTNIPLAELEAQGISYVPCTHQTPILKFAHLWDVRSQVNLSSYENAHGWKLEGMNGVQIMTGLPTYLPDSDSPDGYQYLTLLDVEARFIERYPDAFNEIENLYRSGCESTPCIVQSKSGGRHYYFFCPYLAPKIEFQDADEKKMLVEVFSRKGLGRLDDRYRMVEGSILNSPHLPKSVLQQIYTSVAGVAVERQHQNPDDAPVVERSQLGNLDLIWRAVERNDRVYTVSQYFPLSYCQATEHRELGRKAVQFQKERGGVRGHCFNCGGSWWEAEPTKPRGVVDLRRHRKAAIPYVPEPEYPPHKRFQRTPELRIVSNHAFGISSDSGWQTGLTHRRLSAPNDPKSCSHCGGDTTPEIDFGTLEGFFSCGDCGDSPALSYLGYELNRKPDDSIFSDFQGYVGDDPLLTEESLWNCGIFHLGAPMGRGKTTLVYKRAREAAESGALTIILVPRISLAQAVHAELREDTTLGWSLHYEGSERSKPKSDKWRIGNLGAVATIGMLPHLLQVIKRRREESTVRIFFDEIDFTSSLILSDIFKKMSAEIKETLKAIIEAQGIVTAGQTASTLALEAIAKELNAPLRGYYLSPRPANQTATLHIIDSHSIDHPKNRLTRAVIEKIQDVLDRGKNAYVFADERRFCQIVASLFPDETVVYDAYHRDSPEAKEMLRLKRLPDGKRIFVSSNAVDVGISIEDENAETVVVSLLNPLTAGGYDSVVQRAMRNRRKPPLTIYLLNYQNSLPLAPDKATDFYLHYAQHLSTDGEDLPQSLAELIGIEDAMNSLVDNQPETFIKHHLSQAGFSVATTPLALEQFDFESVQRIRKEIREAEDAAVINFANDILDAKAVLTESEIRQRDWESQQPAPVNQRAYERANASLQACGWNGKVDRFVDEENTMPQDPVQAFENAGVTHEMWQTAREAVGLNPEKIERWKRGYISIHYPEAARKQLEESRGDEFHHRPNDLFIGAFLKALLERLPREPAQMEAIGRALIDAAQVKFGFNTFSDLMKKGGASPTIGKRVIRLDLGRDAIPTEAHLHFVHRFLSEHYPARISKNGDLYQLAQPQNMDEFELFKQVVRCHIKHRHPDIDPDDPDDPDLTPPPAADPFYREKAAVLEGRRNGESCRGLAVKVGMSKSWIDKHTQGVEKGDKKAETKTQAVQMRGAGMTFEQIARQLEIPRSTVHGWMSYPSGFVHENSYKGPYTRNSVDKTGCSQESLNPLQTRATTAFEADSAPPPVKPISETASRSVKPISETILGLLASGKKTTKEIVQAIDAKYNSVTDELRRLVASGKIEKPRRGVYRLPLVSVTETINVDENEAWEVIRNWHTSDRVTEYTLRLIGDGVDGLELSYAAGDAAVLTSCQVSPEIGWHETLAKEKRLHVRARTHSSLLPSPMPP